MHKRTISFTEQTYLVLSWLSEQLERNMAEIIREAISLLWFVVKELKAGNKVLIKRGNEVTELVIPGMELTIRSKRDR